MTEQKIIQFDPSVLQAKTKPNEHYCRHANVFVVEKTRMLECQQCGQIIDPFDFMWQWANRDRNLQWTRDKLKKDIDELGERLSDMKKEEKNARARLKRLGVRP